MTGNLKFYHSGKTYSIESQTGTQQGDLLRTVLFSAPLQPLLHKIADTYSSILILAFADNVCLMGPSIQVLPGLEAFATTMDTIPTPLNPCRILNLYTQPHPTTTQMCNNTNAIGPNTPMHILGNQDSGLTNWQHFEEEHFKKIRAED